MHPNPNPSSNPPPSDPYYSSHYTYYSQNPVSAQFSIPHVYSQPSTTEPKPPGVDSYPSLASFPQVPQVSVLTCAQTDASGYYLDPNLQNWAAKEAVRQYGSDPAGNGGAVSVAVSRDGTQQLAVAQPGSTIWTNFAFQLQGNENLKKRQKKTKIVQSAYCEVCKVDCNSKEVLDQHKLGKKHKKNLEKLLVATAGPSAASCLQNPIIGPQLDPNKQPGNIQKTKNKATKPLEDLETKRRKIVGGGAAQESIKVCAICNVVCNSENVYRYHLAGRKHAATLKKIMGGVSLVAAT